MATKGYAVHMSGHVNGHRYGMQGAQFRLPTCLALKAYSSAPDRADEVRVSRAEE
jgi:hypothetical protein